MKNRIITVIFSLAFLSVMVWTCPAFAQNQPVMNPGRLMIPAKKAAAKTATTQAHVPDTMPGTLPDLNNKVKALTERISKLEGLNADQIERLQKSIDNLRKELAALKQAARKPECSSDDRYSVNPATNIRDDCAPYACNDVTGLCRTQCAKTTQCVKGAVCDRDKEKCIWANR